MASARWRGVMRVMEESQRHREPGINGSHYVFFAADLNELSVEAKSAERADLSAGVCRVAVFGSQLVIFVFFFDNAIRQPLHSLRKNLGSLARGVVELCAIGHV